MSPVGGVSGDTTSLLVRAALDAAMARHAVIAHNVANVNNEGYRPWQVSFDERVAILKAQLLDPRNDAASARAIESLREAAVPVQSPVETTERVQLDAEVAKLARNSLHYQALLSAHGKLKSMIRMAVSGGR